MRTTTLTELTALKGDRIARLFVEIAEKQHRKQTRPHTSVHTLVFAWRDKVGSFELPYVITHETDVTLDTGTALQAHLLNLPPPAAHL